MIIRALLDPVSRSGRILFEHSQDYEWIVSQAITEEYLDVTNRPAIAGKLARKNRSTAGFLGLLAEAKTVRPDSVPAICRDPCDDKFLAAALAGNADYIVSEDLDLLSIGAYEGIAICDTRTMIGLLGDAEAR